MYGGWGWGIIYHRGQLKPFGSVHTTVEFKQV